MSDGYSGDGSRGPTGELNVVQGDHLYAVTGTGLAILDLAATGGPRVLGRAFRAGQPSALYVSERVAVVVYRHVPRAEHDAGGVHTSGGVEIVAFDVSRPSEPSERDHIAVAGTLLASRRNADFLELALEDGDPCRDMSVRTVIHSVALNDAQALRVADSVSFARLSPSTGDSRMVTVALTSDGAYVQAAIDSSAGGHGFQRLTLEPHTGKLAASNVVALQAAPMEFDVHADVLRVLTAATPVTPFAIETFRLGGAPDPVPVARHVIEGSDEYLGSSRFFGPTITWSTELDVLEVWDFSDPGAPERLGQVSSPSRYFSEMTSTGELLFIEGGPEDSAPTTMVSLYAVGGGKEAERPVELEVSCQGRLGSLHRETGLLFLRCLDAAEVRVIAVGPGSLTAVATLKGTRSAWELPMRSQLLTVGFTAVDVYDVNGTGRPVSHVELTLPWMSGAVRVADTVLGLARDGADRLTLATRPLGDSLSFAPSLELVLELSPDADVRGLFAQGDRAYLTSLREVDVDEQELSALVFDVADPTKPALLHEARARARSTPRVDLDHSRLPLGAEQVMVDGRLVTERLKGNYDTATQAFGEGRAWLEVWRAGEGDDAAPTKISLPSVHGLTGLRAKGSYVFGSHFAEVEKGKTATFFIDRVDLREDSAEVESFNVPGALFEVLSSDRILVVEYTQPALSLHLVKLAATGAEVLDTLALPVGLEVGAPQASDSHVFATLYPVLDGAQRGSCDSSCGCSTVPVDTSRLAIITSSSDSLALRVSVLSSGRAEVLDVAGSSAIVRLENTQALLRVDATDVEDPMFEVLDGVASLQTNADGTLFACSKDGLIALRP